MVQLRIDPTIHLCTWIRSPLVQNNVSRSLHIRLPHWICTETQERATFRAQKSHRQEHSSNQIVVLLMTTEKHAARWLCFMIRDVKNLFKNWKNYLFRYFTVGRDHDIWTLLKGHSRQFKQHAEDPQDAVPAVHGFRKRIQSFSITFTRNGQRERASLFFPLINCSLSVAKSKKLTFLELWHKDFSLTFAANEMSISFSKKLLFESTGY